jgi:ribosomal protein S18 acetylase RimI-like enzyme
MFSQFGVEPGLQRRGIGSILLDLVERRARETGAGELALDTAEGAAHLIKLYEKRGYRFVEHADWEKTNYRSVVLSKRL